MLLDSFDKQLQQVDACVSEIKDSKQGYDTILEGLCGSIENPGKSGTLVFSLKVVREVIFHNFTSLQHRQSDRNNIPDRFGGRRTLPGSTQSQLPIQKMVPSGVL